MALQAVKDKLDKQALAFEEEQVDLKEKCNHLRQQEEALKNLKERLTRLSKPGETTAERKE
jgi:septation ring formation regulator EzrA